MPIRMKPADKRVVVKALPNEIRVRIFPTQEFINKYVRPYWRVDYKDGRQVLEILEDGSERDFKEIDLEGIKQLHIIGRGNIHLLTPEYNVILRQKEFDYFLDCRDGRFYFGDEYKEFPCSGLNLDYSKGLILYKEASVPIPTGNLANMPPLEPRIDSLCFGYKIRFQDKKYQVICKVKLNGEYSFIASCTDLKKEAKTPLSFNSKLKVRRKD